MRHWMLLTAAALALGACATEVETVARPSADVAEDAVDQASPPGDSVTTSSGGSCVETYSLDTLGNRRFAFDGTVTDVSEGEPDEDAGGTPVAVTYDVHQWFAGGDGDSVTLASWDFIADGGTGDPPLVDGARLLVSGDTDMAWGCGFTRPYSAAEADQWSEAFSD